MKVLILFCLAGVGLLLTAAPAYARTVRKDLSLQRQHPQLNQNNNNNRNNKHLQEHPVEALVATLKSEVNAAYTLETTLEPPHTTKSPIRFGEKQRTRANSKFLQRPEDANVLPQHTVNNDELELVENTTESPKRQVTTAASDNNKSEAAVDHAGSTAKLRENKKQEVDNEKPAEAAQSGTTEVSGTKNGKENKQSTNNGKGEVNANIKNKKSENNNKANKVNANKKHNNKPKKQPLKVQIKRKKSTPKTNRKVNKGGNKNKKTNSKKKSKKSKPLRKPSNKQNRRRNRFRRRPNRRHN